MTTNVYSLSSLSRNRSKSISNVFWSEEDDDEKEDLLPNEKVGSRSTLDKWMSNLNLKRPEAQETGRRGRANSIFSRPPSQPRPSRRRSLAEVLRKPVGLKDDIKRIWENRPSLTAAKKHVKRGMYKSVDSLSRDEQDSVTGTIDRKNKPRALGGDSGAQWVFGGAHFQRVNTFRPTFSQLDARFSRY